MVKVPEYPAGGAVQTPIGNPESQALSMQQAGALGGAVAQFGGVAANVAGVFHKERIQSETAGLETRALTEFDAFKRSLREDPDFETYDEKYREFARKKSEDYQKSAGQGVWRQFSQEFRRIVAGSAIDVKQQGWTKQVDVSRARMNVELEDLANLHARTTDPVERARIMELGADTILSRADNGFITSEQASVEAMKFRNRTIDTQLRNDTQADPDATLRRLQTDGYPDMSEDRRAVWTERAMAERDQRTRSRVAMQDREDRIAQREKKALQQNTAAEYYILDAQGTLSSEQVMEAMGSGTLSVADGKALLKTTTETRDDPAIVDALYQRLIDGSNIQEDLLAMRRAGLVTSATFNTIWNRNQTQLNKSSPKTTYEQGRTYLMTVLTPSEFESNHIARIRKGEAMVEYDAWAQSNPDATREQSMEMARDIAERASLVGPEQFGTVGTLLPRFMVGTREKPDLEATEQRMNQHYFDKHGGDLNAIYNDPDYRRDLDKFSRFRKLSEGAK